MKLFRITAWLISGVLASASVSGVAFAEKKKKERKEKKVQEEGGGKKYHAHYGMAGCGLGSLIIKDDDTWPQVGSALLNSLACQIGICQTFAISSGTMNCTEDGSSAEFKSEKEVYVEVNFDDMSKEAAQGGGEHLSAYADMLGCQQPEHVAVFAALSQSNYQELYGAGDRKSVVDTYDHLIKSHGTLSSACTRAG